MTSATKSPYAGYRFPGEVISHAVWLYFRFPLSLRMVEEMLAARGIDVSHETVRQWARKFGQSFANQIRRKLPDPGDKWHLDEVCLMIGGQKHWLWRAVDQDGVVLDVLVQSRRDKRAAKRLLRKLLKKQGRAPRVMVTDKLASYGAAKGEVMPSVEHRRHKGLVWGHRCQGSSSAAAFLRVCWAGRRLRANPRGARHRARGSSRRDLVSGGPLGARTMMQPCASAAKLRGGGSNLNSGFQAIPLFGAPPPRIIHGSSPRGRR
jgi:transposase-like protein